MAEVLRPTLGSYMSIECFRFLRFGAEDTAGRALIVSSGKQRGHSLSDILGGLSANDTAAITQRLSDVLGVDGTRLCLVHDVSKTDDGFTVRISESACASGLKADEPVCAYSLGVFIGALEVITGTRIHGRETECTATGYDQCLYTMTILT